VSSRVRIATPPGTLLSTINDAFETWPAAENFDESGRQGLSLSSLTEALLVTKS
jgi:hypothetical protein